MTAYPLVASVYNQSLVRPDREFVGLRNYSAAWPDFVDRLGTTLVSPVLATLAPLMIGVALAMLLNTGLKGRNLLRRHHPSSLG